MQITAHQYQAPHSRINHYVQKPDPDFLLIVSIHFFPTCNLFWAIRVFSPAFDKRGVIWHVRWRPGQELTSSVNLSAIPLVGRWNFSFNSHRMKVISSWGFFDLQCWTPIDSFGEGIFRLKIFFIDQTQKAPPRANLRRVSHQPSKSVESFDQWTIEKKIDIYNQNRTFHICVWATPSRRIPTKYVTIGDLADMINGAKCHVDRWRVINFRGRNLHVPIGKRSRP